MERQGIEIDYCPRCRGVWLDRGELDKIIDRSMEMDRNSPSARRDDYDRLEDRQHPRRFEDDDEDRYREDPRYRRRKRGGFLGELFDFD
jgi:hypothetical protein